MKHSTRPLPDMALFSIVLVFVILLALAVSVRAGAAAWSRESARLVGRLGEQAAGPGGVFRADELEGLPTPVARYFRRALTEGQPLVRRVRLLQRGGFNMSASEERWRRLEATEHFRTGSPGFVWDARIGMLPLVTVRVRDAYLGGEGSMSAKLLSLFPLAREQGRAELDAGALQRYLGEAVWFPTALLPSQGVRWKGIDEQRALATLTDGETTVSLEFEFSEEGDVTRVFTPARYRAGGGRFVPTPWGGRFADHRERDGMRIPLEGEVAWFPPEGRWPYWRGRIVSIEYEYSE
ncbi:MAG: hypothetical protein P8Y66_09740 [Nitrospirota bacterium]